MNKIDYFELVQFTTEVYNTLKPYINPYYETQLIIEDGIINRNGVYLAGGAFYHKIVKIYLNNIVDFNLKEYKDLEIFKIYEIIKINIACTIAHELFHTIQDMNYNKYCTDIEYCKHIEGSCISQQYEFIKNNIDNMCNYFKLHKELLNIYIDEYLSKYKNYIFKSMTESCDEYYISILYEILQASMCDISRDDINNLINDIINLKNIYIICNDIKYTIKKNNKFNLNNDTINKLNLLEEYFAMSYYSDYKTSLRKMEVDFDYDNKSESYNIIIKSNYTLYPIRRFALDRVLI